MTLYAWILLLSVAVPFAAGFHPRLRFYQKWPALFPAIFLSMVPYIIWDVVFTGFGIWGFSEQYVSKHLWAGLPPEEWLFFICIPYACVFTHYAILDLRPGWQLGSRSARVISYTLSAVFLIVLIAGRQLAYTSVDMVFAAVVLLLVYKLDFELLRTFYVTFLFMLIPFFIVNGLLTGSFIEGQVVWYNDLENLGLRLFTIPVEDMAYAFSLILLTLFLYRRLNNRSLQTGIAL